MSLRVLIVDDEPLARQRLGMLCGDLTGRIPVQVAGEAGDGVAALEAVGRLNPDVLLLDIEMPGMDGLEVARHLSRQARCPAVIFVTAYDRFAVTAFEVSALDYLVKPVRSARLEEALKRVWDRDSAFAAQAIAQHPVRHEPRDRIAVMERGRIALIAVSDLLYCRADQKYVALRTPAATFLSEESLTTLEAEFADYLVRIHRNALVAKNAMAAFERAATGDGPAEGRWEVVIRGTAERLPVSRRQWSIVKGLVKG